MTGAAIWERLEAQVGTMVDEFPGVAGVCVKDLTRGDRFSIRGEELFPTASTIKIHVLTQLLLLAEQGKFDLDQKVRLQPEVKALGSGVLTYLEGPVELSALDIAILMIIISDNTATNLCIDWAGVEDTNILLRELGLTETTLRRKMQDREAIAQNRENVATPDECVAMMELLYQGNPTPGVAERCLDILKKPKSAPLFNRAIPADVPLANKPGGMERVRCDTGIIYLERRPYALAVMTKFALCEPPEQERFVIDVARTVHETMTMLDSTSEFGQGIVG
jgi:beta-lactamase class A